MLEQYAQAGKDIHTLLGDYNTLASTGKTSLGLNQWDKNDKPTMEDFNRDNLIVDEAIVGLEAEVEKKVEKAEVEVLLANKANAGAPQEYDMPLAAGLTATLSSLYRKNQFGEVSWRLFLDTTEQISDYSIIATLPDQPAAVQECTQPCSIG